MMILASLFKTYLVKEVVINFINSMIEESKYRNNVMKKHFNEEHLIPKKANEDF